MSEEGVFERADSHRLAGGTRNRAFHLTSFTRRQSQTTGGTVSLGEVRRQFFGTVRWHSAYWQKLTAGAVLRLINSALIKAERTNAFYIIAIITENLQEQELAPVLRMNGAVVRNRGKHKGISQWKNILSDWPGQSSKNLYDSPFVFVPALNFIISWLLSQHVQSWKDFQSNPHPHFRKWK